MAVAKKAFVNVIQDLDLVPIMNLVVCLIPMILWGASLVKLGVVNVSAARFGTETTEPAPDVQHVNITLHVAADGFHISADGDALVKALNLPADQPVLHIQKRGDHYDHAGLYSQMVALRTHFPQEPVLSLTAEPTTPVGHLIAAMDGIRNRLEADTYREADTFRAARVRMEQGVPQTLWPDVAISYRAR